MPRPASQTLFDALGRHPVHPFPARMAPEIVCSIIRPAGRRPLRILDPMMGSGTVVALAQSRHHHAVGIDIDPLATLISRVWTTPVDKKGVKSKAIRILDLAERIALRTPASAAFPAHAGDRGVATRITDNLKLYESRKPCRTPWRPDEPIEFQHTSPTVQSPPS